MSRGLADTTAPSRTGRGAVLVAAATVAAVDLTAKAISEARLADSTVDFGLLQLRLGYNSGVAFSMADNLPAGVIVAVTAAICVAFAVYAWFRAPRAGRIERVASGAVIGGAVANVIDRARDGVVTDYLHTGWWPTFNLADTFLVVGCITIALAQARPQPTLAGDEPSAAHPSPTDAGDP
ncbi:signal peptidase II [Nocardioides sp. Arc9.136]|uniref:signal peptidase II n=1 Tax=Nocardioides sp. Arc9.136 TaxID=2996826 RepID=UPI0026658A25|nr:signal peptidase II [Nocardioides sp. Arc9.136]WKN46635.1 signal peptidase II [Nocardioides sp. Arc9.136]